MAGGNFVYGGGEAGAAGKGCKRKLRMAGVQSPDSRSRHAVPVSETSDQRLNYPLGFQRSAENTAQIVDFLDQVHAIVCAALRNPPAPRRATCKAKPCADLYMRG